VEVIIIQEKKRPIFCRRIFASYRLDTPNDLGVLLDDYLPLSFIGFNKDLKRYHQIELFDTTPLKS